MTSSWEPSGCFHKGCQRARVLRECHKLDIPHHFGPPHAGPCIIGTAVLTDTAVHPTGRRHIQRERTIMPFQQHCTWTQLQCLLHTPTTMSVQQHSGALYRPACRGAALRPRACSSMQPLRIALTLTFHALLTPPLCVSDEQAPPAAASCSILRHGQLPGGWPRLHIEFRARGCVQLLQCPTIGDQPDGRHVFCARPIHAPLLCIMYLFHMHPAAAVWHLVCMLQLGGQQCDHLACTCVQRCTGNVCHCQQHMMGGQ